MFVYKIDRKNVTSSPQSDHFGDKSHQQLTVLYWYRQINSQGIKESKKKQV